jgi:ectoine hydroxylase-related dioxygenase (phytanoyl-CoA dioxygenase family)
MRLSAEELETGQLKPETLESAVRQVNLNGYLVFEEVPPESLVDEMNTEFLRVLDQNLKNNPESTEVNSGEFRKNRVRMDLPFYEPFTDPRVITNSFVLPVIERLLGDDCRCFYLSVDAPMPGSDYQVVHGDYRSFYPESNIILPITGLVVNIPLIDVTEENGPMEAWPGTHFTPECHGQRRCRSGR